MHGVEHKGSDTWMNINNASAEQLEEAFQVDGTRARYLIEQRNKLGSFTTWEQVKQRARAQHD